VWARCARDALDNAPFICYSDGTKAGISFEQRKDAYNTGDFDGITVLLARLVQHALLDRLAMATMPPGMV
jgi:hypothetical protein